jgi:hypothetical protein
MLKPMSCVTIAQGMVVDFADGVFQPKNETTNQPEGDEVHWCQVKVAIIGATVTAKLTPEQYAHVKRYVRKGETVTVAGQGSVKDKQPVINRLVSFKREDGQELIVEDSPENAAANPRPAAMPPSRRAAA